MSWNANDLTRKWAPDYESPASPPYEEGNLCPKCEKGNLEERLEGDYSYLICPECYKKQPLWIRS